MELKTFVTTVLNEIINGVKDAQLEATDPRGGQVNPAVLIQPTSGGTLAIPPGRMVSTQKQLLQSVIFDVAVTVEEGTGTKGGIGIFMGAIGIGSQGESTASKTSISRIQFEVPVSFPSRDS